MMDDAWMSELEVGCYGCKGEPNACLQGCVECVVTSKCGRLIQARVGCVATRRVECVNTKESGVCNYKGEGSFDYKGE